jgi:hypothetical protein
MIADLGKTFGRANALNHDTTAAVNFKAWSGMAIWKESAHGCIGNLPGSWSGTLHDPHIGEAGRKFLADLLNQLTDSQIHDLFEVARFTERDASATIEDWVLTFKRKRTDIVNSDCSVSPMKTGADRLLVAQPVSGEFADRVMFQ